MKKTLARLAAAHLLVGGSSLAHAQTAPETEDNRPGLDVIVVTAEKRSANLQKVPIAIAAVTSDAIARNSATTTQSLQFNVPGLIYTNAATNAQPYMRGVGSQTTGPNFDASVATYIDGVFVANTAATLFNLLAVDRVEVLKGPQGTLYGRNATGGAINIYTQTPEQEQQAKVGFTYGNYHRIYAVGQASGGVSDTLALGIYASYNHRDTFFTVIGDTQGTKEENEGGVRVKAVWEPTPAVTLTGSAEYLKIRSFERAAVRNIQPDALGYTLGAPQIIEDHVVTADSPVQSVTTSYSATLREDIDLGNVQILGVTGYRRNKVDTISDIDGTTAPLVGTSVTDYPSRQFSQELQVLSAPTSPVEWIAGLYFFDEKSSYLPVLTTSPGGVLFPAPIISLASDITIKTRSYAAFAQAKVPLTESLSVTVGGRYTIDKKTFDGNDYALDGVGTMVVPVVQYPTRKATFKKFTPKVSVEYDAGPSLLYATFSKGFKSGAFNWAVASDPGPVRPECLTAYEIGAKNDLAGGNVRFNLAGYYYEHKGIQEQGFGGTSLVTVQNAASGKLYGAEAELTVAAGRELTLTGTIAWQHTEYTSFPDASSFVLSPLGNANVPLDATGNQMPRAPEWVLSLGADYEHELGNGDSIGASVKWLYNDGFFWEATNRLRQESYHLVNASVDYNTAGGLTLRGFMTNLTDTHYDNGRLFTPVSIIAIDGEPRMYGVSLIWNY